MKRLIFWIIFIVIIGLIIWGVVVAMGKPVGPKVGDPSAVTTTEHVFMAGPAAASASSTVTIVEYSDFQCPACGSYFPIVEHVLASSTVPIKFVYRHFPLPQHPNAPLAAQASEAASLQGKFFEMYRTLFKNQAAWVDLGDPHVAFEGYAEKLGLDVAQFRKDIDSDAVKAAVAKNRTEAQTIKLFQTPTFFVNGKLIENPQGYDKFKTVVEAAAH